MTESRNQGLAASLSSPLPDVFELALIMQSDWHVGSGGGRPGSVDSLVRRDADGLPYVPAKTLTGMWRDACEQLVRGLDGGSEEGSWSEWVDVLFGDQPSLAVEARDAAPRASAISIRPLRLPEVLRKALGARPLVAAGLTFVKPGVALDPGTGTAKDDQLRFEEMVRGGTVLEGRCTLELPGDDEQRRTAFALLVVASRLVKRIGGGRRRGSGRCELTLRASGAGGDCEDVPIDAWIDWLRERHVPPSSPTLQPALSELTARGMANGEAKDGWAVLPLTISTVTPVVVPTGIRGNAIETAHYLPGTYVPASSFSWG